MKIVLDQGSPVAPEMSVAGHNVKEENEVNAVTTSTVFASSNTTETTVETPSTRPVRSSAHYTAPERFVAGLGLALLRWSNRRADLAQPSHARMALLLENGRVRASHAPFGTTSAR
jgi:hypothetical protein